MAKNKKEVQYSPYCELCGGCGEDGCCSYIGCFSALIDNPKCDYGRTYVKDAILNKKLLSLTFELFDKLENDEAYTKEMFIFEFNEKSDVLYNERFDIKKDDNKE